MTYELVTSEAREGFTINFYAAPEYDNPSDHFDDAETVTLINDGWLSWFSAKVTASVDGVELGQDYLGGCAYASPKDFVYQPGYYDDMIVNAITQAKDTLERLRAFKHA